MRHIFPHEHSRKGFMEFAGVPVTYEEACAEITSPIPLAILCLSTFAGFGTLIQCTSKADMEWVMAQPAKSHQWYITEHDSLPSED